MAQNYTLRVTAGSQYDPTTHKLVPVNTPEPVSIESDLIHADLNVRIQNYRGLPRGSPNTSPYFSIPPHAKNKDAYSICFQFTLKQDVNGDDLVFGNDFDHPIRDRLPPGFGTALKIVKWAVDPGLDGDVHADEPYLYGPAASSMNTLHVGSKGRSSGEKSAVDSKAGLIFQEGGSEEGLKVRGASEVPETESARKKFFLNEDNRRNWEWESGRTYGVDFFNAYLDFNDFALRLPGFTLPIMKYWDGQGLRYVLKNRKTNKVLLVILFTLYLNEDLDEHGNPKPGVQANIPFDKRENAQAETNGTKRIDAANGEKPVAKENEKFYEAEDDID